MRAFQPYRSLLFTPGSERRRMGKALGVGADAVIFDLEDAVSDGAKEAARAEVRAMLEVLPESCPPVYVRINSPAAGFLEQDLTALVPQALAGIMLPKAETCDQVTQVAAALDKLEGGQTEPLELLLLVETAVGIRNSYELASSSARVSRLVFGAVDYSLDLGVSLSVSSEAMAYAQCKLVVDSRAAGLLPPVDTVWPAIRDLAGLRETACRARRAGMGGKLLIHPDQIGPVHEIFSPSPAEVEWAQKVVSAYRELQRTGRGVSQLDGQMIERPIYLRAVQICRLAGLDVDDR